MVMLRSARARAPRGGAVERMGADRRAQRYAAVTVMASHGGMYFANCPPPAQVKSAILLAGLGGGAPVADRRADQAAT